MDPYGGFGRGRAFNPGIADNDSITSPPSTIPGGRGRLLNLPPATQTPTVPPYNESATVQDPSIPFIQSVGRGRGRLNIPDGASMGTTAQLPMGMSEALPIYPPTAPRASGAITMGRGRLKQLLLEKSSTATTPSDSSSSVSSTPLRRSVGRGWLLGRMSEGTPGTQPTTPGLGQGLQSNGGSLATTEPSDAERVQPAESGIGTHDASNCTIKTPLAESGFGTNATSERIVKTTSDKQPLADAMNKCSLSSGRPAEPIVDKGSRGTKIEVATNYIKLSFRENKGVYHYMVQFNPAVDNKNQRYLFVRQKMPVKRGIRCYDGGSTLYLPERLPKDETILECTHPDDGSRIEMVVTLKRALRMSECTSLLGTLFQNCTKELKFVRLGRQNYNPQDAQSIPQHKLTIWPGYVTAVDEREDGVYLTCDLLHRVLRFETVYEALESLKRGGDFKMLAMNEMIGASVLTHYNNRLYRVDDITWEMTPLSTFQLSNGETLTFEQYYKKQYNLQIKDLQQPLLISKEKKMRQEDTTEQLVLLVPELCYLTGITEKMRSDFRVMKDIAMYTRLTPQQRQHGLRTFIKSLKGNEAVREMFHEWGLEIPGEAIHLPGRVLDPVEILFGKGRKVVANADWGRAVRSNPVFQGVDLEKWVLIHHQKDGRRANNFATLMLNVAPGMGINIRKPDVVPLNNDRIDIIIKTLQTYVTPGVQAVVVIMSSQREDVYGAIKKFCSHTRPVASQVVLSNTLAKEDKVRPIVQNIALQIIAKLGGALWAVPTPLKRTMVCGIDTYHDKSGKNSVGAVVASLDSMFTQYISQAAMQKPGVELMDCLVHSLINAISQYFETNQALPDRIIVFRDGVGEGAMSTLQHEVEQFMIACRTFNPSYNPKLVFIVVLKRIGIRYFAVKGQNYENPPPGTVLDHSVTKRNFRDFMIVSQLVRHGTATPTHYVVLRDDSNMPIDNIQRITYFFCHMYYNWPGTVRVPAPCLYSHKLAGMVGQYTHTIPATTLQNRLHYL